MISFLDLREKGAYPLQINSGTQPFGSSRFIPKGDWRDLTAKEREQIGRKATWVNTISLLPFPASLREFYQTQIQPTLYSMNEEGRSERLCSLAERMQANLYSSLTLENLYTYELTVHQPGQFSTAYDHQIEQFVGMHIDTHNVEEFSQRRNSFHLCAVNLGQTERYFQFVDLNAEELLEKVSHHKDLSLLKYDMRELTAAFLSENPEYPVHRIVIQPDEAYLAASQFILHDGATNHKGLLDTSFFLAGNFFYGASIPG